MQTTPEQLCQSAVAVLAAPYKPEWKAPGDEAVFASVCLPAVREVVHALLGRLTGAAETRRVSQYSREAVRKKIRRIDISDAARRRIAIMSFDAAAVRRALYRCLFSAATLRRATTLEEDASDMTRRYAIRKTPNALVVRRLRPIRKFQPVLAMGV